jgi:glycosyltransferase involved in cell wall biosynthesis
MQAIPKMAVALNSSRACALRNRDDDLFDYDFSVIIPTFNSFSVIRTALLSVLRQAEVSVQIVVIDGASTDDTCAFVQDFVKDDLVLVSEPDRGIYDAVNKGLGLAKGKLIGVLGSDDIYCDGALGLAFEAYVDSGAGIVAGRASIGGLLRADEPYGVNALISGIPFCHNAMFATRETYDQIGGYDIRYRICADADWVHRAILRGVACREVDATFVQFGTEGTSSVQSDLIMEESYALIASHFPGLSREEAQRLLYAARRWAPVDSIRDIWARSAKGSALASAISSCFPEGPAEVPPDGSIRRLLRTAYAALSRRIQ